MSAPKPASGPLLGVRILDFTGLYPGPLATMLLADLGAEVIRIDSPTRPDMLRYLPPYDEDEVGAAYRTLGRNKRSLCLNLKAPQAKALIYRLVERCDVVVEQFRPGVMTRLGLDYPTLKQHRPDLVYCAISSYGQTGPWRERAGHDINFLATAGLSHHIGRQGAGPVPLATLVGDVAGGTWPAVAGILAALLHRERTGEGQLVDISMADGSLLMNALAITQALNRGGDLGPEGHSLSGATVYDYYRTADDRWLAVGALEEKFYVAFLSALGLPELADHWMAHGPDAAQQRTAVAEAIQAKPLAHWSAVFAELDCCVEPVLTPTEATEAPLFHAREMFVQVPDEDGGTQTQLGNPIRMSASPARYERVGPLAGAHNTELLTELGLSAPEIAALKEQGALG